VTAAPLVLAAALAGWGSAPAPASVPASDAVATTDAAPEVESPPPPSTGAPLPVKQLFDEPGPVSVLSRPAPAPLRPARSPLYRDWRFWAISGSLFAASVVVTILVTRPGPQPYPGNLPPNVISFP
jgi:hypothetical protein